LKLKDDFFILVLAILPLGLTGCNELSLRKGPDPVISATSVTIAASNQIAIIRAFAQDAGYDPDGPVDYYRVAEAGFNYVDDQCRAYFDEMFFIDRGRSQVKSGLAAASATTAAILGVTNASTLTLSIVASAFGFASSATDIVTGTYLYALPPAATQGLVNRFQAAYRDEASRIRAEINTPTAAYHHIQNYLALCLPPRIEAEVVKAVTAAGARVIEGNSRRTFTVESAASTVLPASRTQVVTVRTSTTSNSAQPPEAMRIGQFERSLKGPELRDLQRIVCITSDGRFTETTRNAILKFLSEHNLKDQSAPDKITDVDAVSLRTASDQGIGCKT